MSRIRKPVLAMLAALLFGALMGSDSTCFFAGAGEGSGGGVVIED